MSVNPTVRVNTYARVSTEMQEEGHSLDAQRNEMREFVAARPGWVIINEFVDAGQSGSSSNRPALQQLRQTIEQKACEVVLVHDLSRLSRSIFDTFELFELLGRQGVGFASVKDHAFDFSTPQGRFFLTVMAGINQYYLDLLKQHTAKGKRERARKGLYNSSVAPYGYRHVGDSDTPPEIDPAEAEAVKLAFETYALGQSSYYDVAEKLNKAGYRPRSGKRFGKETIDDMLRNPFYAGKILYGAKRKGQAPEQFEGKHAALISPELFQACERLRKTRQGSARTYHPRYTVYLLNNMGVCNLCGRTLRAQASRDNRYYREMSRARGYIDCPNAQVGTNADPVEDQLETIIRHLTLPPDWRAELEQLLDDGSSSVALNNKRARLEGDLKRLKQLYMRGYMEDDFDAFEQEHRQIQRELDKLPTAPDLDTLEEALGQLDELLAVWDEAELSEKRELLRLMVREAEIDVAQGLLISLSPYPAFLPLFRQADYLLETGFGRFIPLWPPDQAAEFSPNPQLEPVTRANLPKPPQAVAWPLVLRLPDAPASQRISPEVSDQFKALRQKQQPIRRVVDVNPTGYPALRLDQRKWPEAVLEALPDLAAVEALPPDSLSFIRTVMAPLTPALAATIQTRLAPEGVWLAVDVLPQAMPGHWLFRYFPETLATTGRLAATDQYRLLQEMGLTVSMTLRTYDQAVSVEAALALVERRGEAPLLAGLSEAGYEQGVAQLHRLAAERGRKALLASHLCLVETKAYRPR